MLNGDVLGDLVLNLGTGVGMSVMFYLPVLKAILC